MKTASYHFKWFEKEDGRKRLRASIGEDGKLRIGRTLRAKLPQYIRIGFDENNLTLAIADGHGIGIRCPACGVISAQALSARISAIGFRLPVAFELARNEQTGYLVGKIVPHYHTNKAGQRQFDAEELFWLGESLLCQMLSAKWQRARLWRIAGRLPKRLCLLQRKTIILAVETSLRIWRKAFGLRCGQRTDAMGKPLLANPWINR